MSEHKNTLYIYSKNKAVCGNCGQRLANEAKSCPSCGTVFEGTEYLNVTDVSDKVMQQRQEHRNRVYYSARKGQQTWKIHPLVLLLIILVISFGLVILAMRFLPAAGGFI